jgi:predicted amidohydrolase YtcJ
MAQIELVLENANIISCDSHFPNANTVAIRGNRIAAIGSSSQLNGLKSAGTRVLDCRGKTLVPGFIDAHCHFFSCLRQLMSLDLSPATVKSISEIQMALRRKTNYIPKGTWISGTDYNEFYLAEQRHPTRFDLDAAAPDHPVIISHRSLHACVLNSLAMQKIGIDNETTEPEGGLIERDLESGLPNGIFFEMLPWLQKRIQSPLSPAEFEWGCRKLDHMFLSHGITSFTDATVTNDAHQTSVFSSLTTNGLLHCRVNMMMGFDKVAKNLPHNSIKKAPNTVSGCLKLVISRATGDMLPSQNDLNQSVLAANRAGYQVAIHAVEKDSVAAAVRALEFSQAALPGQYWRNRLEHCSECSAELLPRLTALHAIVVSQPSFLYFHGERYMVEVPPENQPILYPFGSLKSAGLTLAGSSDAPVVDFNPLIGIYSAVSRRAASGQVLSPDQCLDASFALSMYTSQAAYAGFQEDRLGTISPGKLADIAVLNADPLTSAPEKIKEIRLEQTILGGQIVWPLT